MITDYHAAYYAWELTRRHSSQDAEKLGRSIFNAAVDLNPHQIDAALFAFRSPLSRGAILADEVGLGKTIEAGLVVSQLWAERRRRILCILPARAIREAIGERPKILLTATPLQNGLMELYGLVSFIDPHVFGDEDSFRELFARRIGEMQQADFEALRSWSSIMAATTGRSASSRPSAARAAG